MLYRVTTTDGEVLEIDNPAKLPDPGQHRDDRGADHHRDRSSRRSEYVGDILQLCQDRRGVQKKLEYLGPDRVLLDYELPLNEIVLDFYDRLKSLSRGYASLDYDFAGYCGVADWSSSTSWSTASRSTRCRSSSTASAPTSAAGRWSRR